jgi:hypothetical protein
MTSVPTALGVVILSIAAAAVIWRSAFVGLDLWHGVSWYNRLFHGFPSWLLRDSNYIQHNTSFLLLHWYPFHSLVRHFCRTAFASHCTKSVALLYSALSAFVFLTFVKLLTSESTHHVLETKVKTRCKYCGVARATWSGGRIDIRECRVSAGSGEVSGTGAAPYMALKSSIYGTKFSIWH